MTARTVCLHRLEADVEKSSDDFVAVSFGDQLDHTALSVCKCRPVGLREDRLQQFFSEPSREVRLVDRE